MGTLSLGATPAFAAPTNDISVQWAEGTPDVVNSGNVVTAEWRVNVNDDAAAPSNEPVDNVMFSVTLEHGRFAALPDACLTTNVDPVSSISADGQTLICNFGTLDQGTAVAVQTPIIADGATDDVLTATGSTTDNKTAAPGPIVIDNAFGLDMLWDTPSSTLNADASGTDLDFEWTLNLAPNSDPGPDTVTYNLDVAANDGSAIAVSSAACGPFGSSPADAHPWSAAGKPAEQTAPFVGSCTLTQTGPTTFALAISGIDYSRTQVPTQDSTGRDLPVTSTAVASGSVWFRVNGLTASSVALNADAPTYTAPTGQTAIDDPSNNASSKTLSTPGSWVSAWNRAFTQSGGTVWDNTYRVSSGTEVSAFSQNSFGTQGAPATQQLGECTVIDSRYSTLSLPVSFLGLAGSAQTPLPVTPEYYVGTDALVDPDSASYNPDAFDCGTGGADLGATDWTTVAPADLNTVKAVRINYTQALINGYPNVFFTVNQTIKDDAPVGSDIYTFHSLRNGGAWTNPYGGTSGVGEITPLTDDRYPYTTPSRDVLHVVSVLPSVTKSVDRSAVRPGVPATFSLNYSANGGGVVPETVNGFVLVDTLPLGVTYVAGSAATEPVVSTDGSGHQILTWTLDGVPTNTANALTYQAVADASVVPGAILTNSVTASYDGETSTPAIAQTTISDNGTTTIAKTADESFIPNLDGTGNGEGSWTVTVASQDPTVQAFTDTIDILPYNGDGRGTSFNGSYALTDVTAASGATVYYTDADPTSLSDDPADPSNGTAGSTTGNTVDWTTTRPETPTAVRVIGPALAPSATQSFTVGVETDAAVGGDVLVNRAQARAEHTELVMRTSAPITVANFYSASLKKYVQDADGTWHDANTVEDYPSFRPGDSVNYRIVVTNTGEGTLTNVAVSDDKFPEAGAFTIESLASGESETHEFTIVLDDSLGGSLVNTATATADTPPDADVPPTIPPDPAGVEISNYTTVKTSDPESGSTVVAGQTVTYTVTVTQTGSVPANATFTDDLSDVLDDADYNGDAAASIGTVNVVGDGLVWDGTIPVGAVATITYSVTVTTPPGDGVLTNVVTSPGCIPAEDEFPDCTTTHVVGGYTVSKTSDPASGTTVTAGDVITYTATIAQTGDGALTGVVATDDLTAVLDDAVWNDDIDSSEGAATLVGNTLTWTGDLAVGDVVTITYSVTVAPLGTGDGTLTNLITPTSPGGTCVPAEDENPDCTTTHVTGGYTVSKTSNPASGSSVTEGDVITYTVTVAQTGAGALTGVTAADDLAEVLDDASWNDDLVASSGAAMLDGSTLTWTGDLAVGQIVTIAYSVTVGVIGAGDGTLTNVVTPVSPGGDCVPAPDENADCTTTHLEGGYAVSKTSDPAPGTPVTEGDVITYSVNVAQKGPGAVTGATISDDLSAVLDDAGWNGDIQASSGTASMTGTTLTWTGDLAVDSVVTITYSVTVAPSGTGDGVLTNVVTPQTPGGACVPASDENPDCTTTHRIGSYTVSKTSNPKSASSVKRGDVVTYTVTVQQIGPGAVPAATFTDDLSKVLDDASWNGDISTTSGTVNKDGSILTWRGDLEIGAVVTITYSVTVGSNGDGHIVNVVTPTAPGGLCVPAGDQNPECTTTHTVVVPGKPTGLPNTGANVLGGLAGGLGLLALGGVFMIRRRRQQNA